MCLLFTGAIPISGVAYGPTDTVPISYSNLICIGTESSLADCPMTSNVGQGELGLGGPTVTTILGETGLYQNSAGVPGRLVGVSCEGKYMYTT